MGDVNGKCDACKDPNANGYFGNYEIWNAKERQIDQTSASDLAYIAYSKGNSAKLLSALGDPVFVFDSSHITTAKARRAIKSDHRAYRDIHPPHDGRGYRR